MKTTAFQSLKWLNPLIILAILSGVSWLSFNDLRLPSFALLGLKHGFVWFFLYSNNIVFILAFIVFFVLSVFFIFYGLMKRGQAMYWMNTLGWVVLFLLGVIGLGFGS